MSGRSFYLYRHKSGFYRTEILDPRTGERICFRSTMSTNRDEALLIVDKWLREGIPQRKRGRLPIRRPADTRTLESTIGLAAILRSIEQTSDLDQQGAREITNVLKNRGLLTIGATQAKYSNQKLIPFLKNYWDYEKSPYLKDRRAHGHDVTKRTCREAKNKITRAWEPFFGEKALDEITRQDLRNFGLKLRERLAGSSVNNLLRVGITALKWAYTEKMIAEDITVGLSGFTGGEQKREIFTEEEAEKLFEAKNWYDERAYTAALLAATSGLRNGEIRALRGEDIGNKLYTVKTENGDIINVYMLYVRHSWNPLDGLKCTKTNTEAAVHLLPEIREKLLEFLEDSPHKSVDKSKRFIFYSIKKDRPCGAQVFLDGLHGAMEKAGIDRDGRKLDFHSLRHVNGTFLLRKTGDIRKVAKSLRHKSLKMTEHYTNHKDEEEVAMMGAAAAEVFKTILNFPLKNRA